MSIINNFNTFQFHCNVLHVFLFENVARCLNDEAVVFAFGCQEIINIDFLFIISTDRNAQIIQVEIKLFFRFF